MRIAGKRETIPALLLRASREMQIIANSAVCGMDEMDDGNMESIYNRLYAIHCKASSIASALRSESLRREKRR